MTEPQYAAAARQFLADSDREFDAGQRQQASENLYRAAIAALTAIAIRHGWPHHTHRDLKIASNLLAEEYSDPSLFAGFVVAEKFHQNFIHDEMEDYEIVVDRPALHHFVNRVLDLLAV